MQFSFYAIQARYVSLRRFDCLENEHEDRSDRVVTVHHGLIQGIVLPLILNRVIASWK